METKTKIGTGIGILLLIAIGFVVQPDDTHFCEDINKTYHCDSISTYYQLPNGKCWNDLNANKLCRTGWEEIDWSKNETNTEIKTKNISNEGWFCEVTETNELIERCIDRETGKKYIWVID